MSGFETILALLLASTALAVIGKKLKIPIPIAMVLGGLITAVIPQLHYDRFDPELTFTVFVPPLLFRASITTSLRGLKDNLRSVSLLAIGLVAATTAVVGVVAHKFLPGIPWPAAFVLGAILSPPDAIVGISLARALKVPRTIVNIIEGETLLNDTTAFVLYRRAVAAVVTGSFSLLIAVPEFVLIALGGIGVGYLVYLVVRFARRKLHDPILENVIWLLTPFFAYLPAEAVGASGVLSVVVAGILLRQSSPLLVSAQTRLQANHVYDLVDFMLNSLIFVLIGLELGSILRAPQGPPLALILRSTAIITLAIIVTRVVWTYPGAYLPRLSRRVRESEGLPPPKAVMLLAWMGVRGGDSLVTALALPLTIASGRPFPGRALIVATTFGVILATLLVQGLSLRPLIKLLKLKPEHVHEAEEVLARHEMVAAGDARLKALGEAGTIPLKVLERVQRLHSQRTELELDLADTLAPHKVAQLQKRAEEELIHARRHAVVRLRNEQVIDDEVLRHLELELDLEEMRLEISGGDADDPSGL